MNGGSGGEFESGERASKPMSWGDREDRRKARRWTGVIARGSGIVAAVVGRAGRIFRAAGLVHRTWVVDGVVYRERSAVSLKRSLSEVGSGVKEYDVRFGALGSVTASLQYPVREQMRIRYTKRRLYHDLGHDPRMWFLERYRDRIVPGGRVLDLGCGTGAASGELARLVGPSGAVVAIERDGESVRFARQRYRVDHLGFELGWVESLAGEMDGAFSAVVVTDLFRDDVDEPSKSRTVSAIWRLVEDGGLVVVMASAGEQLGEMVDRFEASGARLVGGVGSVGGVGAWSSLGWAGVMMERAKKNDRA